MVTSGDNVVRGDGKIDNEGNEKAEDKFERNKDNGEYESRRQFVKEDCPSCPKGFL